jgi:ribosome biogenesis protein Nip4
MKNIFILLLVLLTTSLHGQVVKIEGRIIDENLNPIEYVNVGILGKSIGTVSDSLGNFILFLDNTLFEHTLLISHLSYENKEMLVSSFNEEKPLVIKLKSKIVELEEVVVHSFHSSIKQKGRDKVDTKRVVKFSISSTSNQNLGAVIGRKFKFSSKKKYLLEEIRFFVKNNDFEKAKFRINIYNIKNGEPDEVINNKMIYKSIYDEFEGWVSVDISDLQVSVDEDVIVGIEWIEHSENGKNLSLPMIVPSLGSTHFYRYGSQSKWKRFRGISTALMVQYREIKH